MLPHSLCGKAPQKMKHHHVWNAEAMLPHYACASAAITRANLVCASAMGDWSAVLPLSVTNTCGSRIETTVPVSSSYTITLQGSSKPISGSVVSA